MGAREGVRRSFALPRPKLGFELSPGEKMGQTRNTRSIGEGCEFSRHLGNIGRSAFRTFDNFRDFNGFRGSVLTGRLAQPAR